MSKSWGDIHEEEAHDTYVTETLAREPATVTPLPPCCGWCGYEFTHPAWNPSDPKTCPNCGAWTWRSRESLEAAMRR